MIRPAKIGKIKDNPKKDIIVPARLSMRLALI